MSFLDELVAANDPTQRGVYENPNDRSWYIRPLWMATIILAGVALVRARRRAV